MEASLTEYITPARKQGDGIDICELPIIFRPAMPSSYGRQRRSNRSRPGSKNFLPLRNVSPGPGDAEAATVRIASERFEAGVPEESETLEASGIEGSLVEGPATDSEPVAGEASPEATIAPARRTSKGRQKRVIDLLRICRV